LIEVLIENITALLSLHY